MEEHFEKEKKTLKLNTTYGLFYFLFSLAVIIAAILMIVFMVITKNFNLCYGIASVGVFYCIVLFISELIRNKKAKQSQENAQVEQNPLPCDDKPLYSFTSDVSKIVLCDYLCTKYNFIESVHRSNFSKPGPNQTKGFLLPDTHYVVDDKERKCFMFAYENDEKEIYILLKTSKEHFDRIHAEHPSACESKFPKVSNGNPFFKLVIDDTYTREQLFAIIDEALGIFVASLNIDVVVEPISKDLIVKHLEGFGKQVLIKHRPNYTQPGRGKEKGLLLADTHYVTKGKQKLCFLYVYEEDNGDVRLLLKMNPKHFEKVKESYKAIEASNFPKVSHGDIFYSITVTEKLSSDQLFEIIDKAIEDLSK